MSEIDDKKTANLASYFTGLLNSPTFIEGFLNPMQAKAEMYEIQLLGGKDIVDIHRAQGALKVIDDIFHLLGRHREKLNKSLKRVTNDGTRSNDKPIRTGS